jgi:type IV pilus assembly protein PilM
MAKSDAVWGVDIGNAALKAIRCRPAGDPEQIEAIAFDYIEYPKLLTQPGADPVELINDALKQFQSRNSVRGDSVAIAVPGQNGLARFIKLPPVETKQIPQIVRYEARQQIPFDLDDVIWDYQSLGGGGEEIEGFALETEVGLFAMKREQVFRALESYRAAGIEVEVVQLTPLALYNYIAFDRFQQTLREDFDPEDPPESTIVLSMGTDASDLVITNGHRVWQRSIPLGGNHFTRALTKELKLTFAKAEHLKRNAATAEDPKVVFQAMRSVFNDLVTEIQRSVGYFTSINRSAKIGGMVALGSAMKLPGLRRYLAQNLGFEVERADSYACMVGPEVLSVPAFQENIGSFGVAYGLAVQALKKSALRTNLLPQELLKERMIRDKKPWAVAAAAILLLGCTLSFVSHSRVLATVENDAWTKAESEADRVEKWAAGLMSEYNAADSEFKSINQIGANLTGNVEGRLVWLELLTAINQCLPSDPEDARPEDISHRNELHITAIDCQKTDDLAAWFTVMKDRGWYEPPAETELDVTAAAGAPASEEADGEAAGADGAAGDEEIAGPSGPGWVVQLTGYHYHNFDVAGPAQGAQYVRNTLIRNLHNQVIQLPKATIQEGVGDEPIVILPTGENAESEEVTMGELGVSYATLVNPLIVREVNVPNPEARPSMYDLAKRRPGLAGAAGVGAAAATAAGSGETPADVAAAAPSADPRSAAEPEAAGAKATADEELIEPFMTLRRFDFTVQFAWLVTPPMQRAANKEAAAAAAAAAAEAAETPAEGDDAAPAEGDDAAPAEGDDAAPAEGDDAAPAEGDDAAPAADAPVAAAAGGSP